jgi:hypothetical protein
MPLPASYFEHLRQWGAAAFAAVILFLSVTALPLASLWVVFPGTVPAIWYAALAVSFGELVGFSEIITRYRDEPLRATFNRYGILYLLINGALSGCAYFLLRAYGARIFPAAQDPPLLAAVVAGFGAMAVLRSKLFVFRTDDGKDIPIGPDLVISSILRIVDRKIDRLRAARRQQLVFELAKRIAAVMASESDFDNPNSFVIISLASFQKHRGKTANCRQIGGNQGKTQRQTKFIQGDGAWFRRARYRGRREFSRHHAGSGRISSEYRAR